jgi:ribosomal protein S1
LLQDAPYPLDHTPQKADELREGRVVEGYVQSVLGEDAGGDVDCGRWSAFVHIKQVDQKR